MIETPTATAFKTTSAEEDESTEVDAPLLSEDQISEKQKLKAMEQDLFLVKQPPITAKLRTAVKHLRSVGGRLARFRGLHVALLYHAIHGFVVNFFASGGGIVRPIASVIVTVVLCRLQMLWTHIVISNPTQQKWYRRFPSVAAGKQVIMPTAVYAIAQQAAIYIPAALAVTSMDMFQNPKAYGSPETMRKLAIVQMCGVILVSLSVFIATIPAKVTLHRIQASLLPEQDETIVPFDRTFGGKVQPAILGGSGAIGMLDAWKTFDKDARTRLIKLYLKLFLIQVFAGFSFVMTIIFELRLIMGDDFNKLVESARKHLRDQQ